MMKKLLIVLACVLSLMVCAACAETADVVSSASTYSTFNAFALLDGAALMEAVNTKGGTQLLITVDESGMPCAGVFGYYMTESEGKYYVCVRLQPDSTRTNIENGSPVFAVYANMDNAYEADRHPGLAVSGAHIGLSVVEDQEKVIALCAAAGLEHKDNGSRLFAFEVTEILGLG